MKITNRQLRRIIKEEIATVNDDAIEDAVMGVLSDEGGAAGLDPIEDALEDLEDDDISLPDEDIEDIIGGVAGVKRHADGDYVDTTQLEGKSMKLTKQQLKRIIKEEKAKILNETPTPYEREEALRFLRQDTGQRQTPPIEELQDDVNDMVFQLLDQELTQRGIDRFADMSAAEVIAGALEDVARMVRNDAKFTARGN